MAGENSEVSPEDCSFVWDEGSQLYFHASTGFYHDPNAGWYYSSRDGIYYKFEGGNYVPLQPDMIIEDETCKQEGTTSENPDRAEPCSPVHVNGSGTSLSGKIDDFEVDNQVGNRPGKSSPDVKGASSIAPENPPPPSEWLEDTLIELYLSNYANPVHEVDTSDDVMVSREASYRTDIHLLSNVEADDYELEEGEWIPEEDHILFNSSEVGLHEEVSEEEENWKAQYGQVIASEKEDLPSFPVTDLWDWAVVKGSKKNEKDQQARLVGRLVKQSAKPHPSVASAVRLLRTSPICEVRFDLVRVRTGQIYKLRSPSARYLASLSSYDSSNPTRDWGFPEISGDGQPLSKFGRHTESIAANGTDGPRVCKENSPISCQSSASDKHQSHGYRDRAAERRNLHGGFGVGPGQKNSLVGEEDGCSSTVSLSAEAAAAEALDMTFGAGSYARKVLENMGWKEGEALGSSVKGLLEPIQAVGNIGNAGLGWPQSRTKRR